MSGCLIVEWVTKASSSSFHLTWKPLEEVLPGIEPFQVDE
jgi:hypothetical protein